MNLKHLLYLLAFLMAFTACDDDDDDDYIGNWTEKSSLDGVPRYDAVGFSIGDNGYVGMGWGEDERLADVWEYDASLDTWFQKADFPGGARNGSVAFAVGTKAYVGLGYDGLERKNDFYVFDPDANTWDAIADFAGSARYGSIAMAIGDYGYVGAGYDGNYLKDFWKYDPSTDSWTQQVSIGGNKRRDAAAFVIDGYGYVVTGVNNGVYDDDLYRFDPDGGDAGIGAWTKMRDIADNSDDDYDDDYTSITGVNKAAFAVGGKGYLVAGGQSAVTGYVWEYDPTTDLWERKTSLEGTDRTEAVAFVVNEVPYVTTGRSSSSYFDDIWLFEPDEEYDEYD